MMEDSGQLRPNMMWLVMLVFAGMPVMGEEKLRNPQQIPEDYDKGTPPAKATGSSGQVLIGMYIKNMNLAVTRQLMELQLDLYQEWADPRLTSLVDIPGERILDSVVFESVWIPDVVIRNALTVREIDASHPQRALKVFPGGKIRYERSVNVDLHCYQMGGGYRESEQFTCSIFFKSYAYESRDVSLSWKTTPGISILDRNVKLRHHSIQGVSTFDCSYYADGARYSCLEIRFFFRRDFLPSLFLAGVYIVSFLLVLLSWAGFWLPEVRILERLTLDLACLVIIAILAVGVGLYNKDSMATHSIEGWMSFCLTLVTATLLEYMFIFVLLRLIPRRTMAVYRGKRERPEVTDRGDLGIVDRIARVIDVACGLVVFPFIFVVYNIYYWSSYLP